MAKKIPDDVKTYVRAVLISSATGVLQTKFCREYESIAKNQLEWRKMGFNDLYEFLLAMPDVARVEYSSKHSQNVIFGVVKKDVYSSLHAQKAGKKGTGEKSRHPSKWGKPLPKQNTKERSVNLTNDLSLKVTLCNGKQDSMNYNEQRLYGVHIRNLPGFCTKEELDPIFREYLSFKLVKIVNKDTVKFAFAKFEQEQDALRALVEKDGYKLRGYKLKLSKAFEGLNKVKQSLERSHEVQEKNIPKLPNLPPLKPVPNDNKVVVNNVNILSEIELMQLYSKYGNVQQVDKHGESASLSFSSEKEALATMQNMDNIVIEGEKLTLSLYGHDSHSKLFFSADEQSGVDNIRGACVAGDLSRCGPSTSAASTSATHGDRSATSSSSKESISSYCSAATPHKKSQDKSAKTSVRDNSYSQQHTHQQQQLQSLHQQQRLPKQQEQQLEQQNHCQQQQQHNQQLRPIPNAAASLPSQHQPEEQSIHLMLTTQEMERLCSAFDHPLVERFQNLPDEMDVLVTEVIDACHFWAIIDNKAGNWIQLGSLEEQLQEISITKPVVPQKYTVGAGKFTENNIWYRCFVVDVSSDHKLLKVLYTDYGNAEWITLDRFMSLDSIYLSLSPQAHAFHLVGLEVNNSNSMEIQLEGAKFFREMIGDKTLLARRKTPIDITQGHILEVELFSKSQPIECVNKRMAATKYVNTKVNSLGSKPSTPSPSNSHTPLDNQTIKLRISWVQHPRHIFYYEDTPESKEALESINKLLDRIPLERRCNTLQVNEYACFVSRAQGRKRVKILENPAYPGVKVIKVFCVDYGNMVHCAEVKSLLQLPAQLKQLPHCAHEARLAKLELPSPYEIWPKPAMDILLNAKDQVLNGEIIKKDHKGPHLKLYNSLGECLNDKIMEIVAPKKAIKRSVSKNSVCSSDSFEARPPEMTQELGPAPISPVAIPTLQHSQGTNGIHQPSNNFHSAVSQSSQQENTPQNDFKAFSRQLDVTLPSMAEPHAGHHASEMSLLRGQTSSNAGSDYYMPPPPNDSTLHDREEPQTSQASGTVGMMIEGSPSTINNWNPPPNVSQGGKPSENTDVSMASSSLTSNESGVPVRAPRRPYPDMASVGEQAARTGQIPRDVPMKTSLIPPSSGPVNQPTLESQNQQWQKEKDALTARIVEQELYIETLSKQDVPKQSSQNLQQLKTKLEKQVRIKALEIQVLKLRKEVETLEAMKANLQFHLLN